MGLGELMDQWRSSPAVGRRVVAFGASNTSVLWHSGGRHGWPCWLMTALRGYVGHHVSLTNAGVSGNNTTDLLERIDRDVLPHAPSLVLVTIGGNDIKAGPVDLYVANLKRLAETLAGAGAEVVLQTYYAFVDHQTDEINHRFPEYMTACSSAADELRVAKIDQHSLFWAWYLAEPDAYAEIMLNALHLNPLGNAVFGTLTARGFGLPDPQLPEGMSEDVPRVLERMGRFANIPMQVEW